MTRSNQPELEDVLDMLVSEHDAPSRAAVVDFIGRYPQYAREITDFAAAWAEQSVLPESPPLPPERQAAVVNRTMSFAANLLFERDSARATANGDVPSSSSEVASAPNLAELVREAGSTMAEFARQCRLSLSFVAKLNNRLVLPQTIDRRLAEMAAELLGVSPARVRASWTGPPRMAAGAAYLARSKPQSAEQVSFSEGIATSGLSAEDQAFWRGV